MASPTNFLVENAKVTPKPTDTAEPGLHAFGADIDDRIAAVDMNRVEHLSFFIDDIPYHVAHARSADNERSKLWIQAIVGYMPFSAESGVRRKSILSIIAATVGVTACAFRPRQLQPHFRRRQFHRRLARLAGFHLSAVDGFPAGSTAIHGFDW